MTIISVIIGKPSTEVYGIRTIMEFPNKQAQDKFIREFGSTYDILTDNLDRETATTLCAYTPEAFYLLKVIEECADGDTINLEMFKYKILDLDMYLSSVREIKHSALPEDEIREQYEISTTLGKFDIHSFSKNLIQFTSEKQLLTTRLFLAISNINGDISLRNFLEMLKS